MLDLVRRTRELVTRRRVEDQHAAHPDQDVSAPSARDPMNGPLPVGTVTFLLTDVEGSTTGWEADRAAMAAAIVRHYEILDAAVRARGGVRPVEQGEGDSVVAVFATASDAVRAAVDIQLALAAESWPDGAPRLAVRMALHTGDAQLRDAGNYMGRAVIRAARLRAIGHGGQILCSGATADIVGDDLPEGVCLVELGAHRLKDLSRSEQVFQVAHPGLRREFPPLRSLDSVPNNLPVHLTSFIGREAELAEVAQLAARHRLVTLTGSGGAGKTRLAARVAAELAASARTVPGGSNWPPSRIPTSSPRPCWECYRWPTPRGAARCNG
jgi:class 3 adenylate cyclase